MAARAFAGARVREITWATQGFVFFTMANAYRVFAYDSLGDPAGERSPLIYLHLAVVFSPFVIARITPLLGGMPALFLRDGARVSMDTRGLLYQFDDVKRPLFVPWDQLAWLRRTRFGLAFRVREGADLLDGMPKFQAEFWRGKTRRPIRLQYVERLTPETGLRQALAAARRAGVEVSGFDTAPAHGRASAPSRG